ncbi:MAG: sulfur carrier protein ThiS [Syntrophomonadaceae bacterium]|jgi:thiamine biosynthesis protein ThiS
MIFLSVNGKPVELSDSISIMDFLLSYKIKPDTVVIELNYDIPERQSWSDIQLINGDKLEIVKFIGGG